MPWPEDHKARTRQKIVDAAAAAFRAGGVVDVRLEDVMARAGLTHGGFYAHFASKDELLREALAHASRQTVDMLSGPLATMPDEGRLGSVIDTYLSPAHVAHPERGCPLAALGPELARTGRAVRGALAASIKARLRWMRQLLPEGERNTLSEAQMIGALACMIGGIVLARTVGEKDSHAVLGACRDFVHGAVEGSRARPTRSRSGKRGRRSSSPSRRDRVR